MAFDGFLDALARPTGGVEKPVVRWTRSTSSPALPRALRAVAVCAGIATSWAAPAAAQAPEISVSDKELARRMLDEGDVAYEAKRYPEAVQKYCQADKIMGVPTTAAECGKGLEALGKLLEANEAYLRAANYQHPAGQKEPDAFVEARQASQRRATSLGARIPELLITIQGVDPGTPVTIKVNGQPLRGDVRRRLVNPAPQEHLVSVSAPGYHDASVTVSAREAEKKSVTIVLRTAQSTSGTPPIAPADKPAKATPPRDKPRGGPPVPALIGFGVGAAGLLTGAITGGVSLAQTVQLKKDCTDAGGSIDNCGTLDNAQARFDKANALANASNVTLAIGGAGLIFGVIALFAFKPSEPSGVAVPEKMRLFVVDPTTVALSF